MQVLGVTVRSGERGGIEDEKRRERREEEEGGRGGRCVNL